MKWYIVYIYRNDWNNIFITKAKDTKDAINIIWNKFCSWNNKEAKLKGYDTIKKEELNAESLESNFCSNNKGYIVIH